MDDRLAFLEPEALQHRIHPLGAEDAHQIVFERDKEFRGARVALAAGAAAQLVVDAPALMTLAADDEKPAGVRRPPHARSRSRRGSRPPAARARPGPEPVASSVRKPHVEVAAKLDVGAATGHVGRDRDRAGPPGLGDDMGFLLVVARVQHVVRRSCAFLNSADSASDFSMLTVPTSTGCCRSRHSITCSHDRVVFLARRAVDLVIGVVAATGSLVGISIDLELVDVAELLRLGHRRCRSCRRAWDRGGSNSGR